MDNLPIITSDKAKAEISVALTRQQLAIQTLQTEADALTFGEDQESLDAAKAYLDKAKKVTGIVEVAHKDGKAPYKERADAWDEAKRSIISSIESVTNNVQKKYNDLSRKLDNQAREAKAKEAREKETRTFVEGYVIEYSKRIAAAHTVAELTTIELSISNHKSPSAKSKYGDLHDEAIETYNTKLIPLLKEKKEQVARLCELNEAVREAEEHDDLESLEEITALRDQVADRIQETGVRAQEEAINKSFSTTPTHTVVLPQVKAKRTTIEFELVNPERALSKAPHLVTVALDKEACKKAGKAIFDDPTMKDTDEVTTNGIRFYKKYVY